MCGMGPATGTHFTRGTRRGILRPTFQGHRQGTALAGAATSDAARMLANHKAAARASSTRSAWGSGASARDNYISAHPLGSPYGAQGAAIEVQRIYR